MLLSKVGGSDCGRLAFMALLFGFMEKTKQTLKYGVAVTAYFADGCYFFCFFNLYFMRNCSSALLSSVSFL